MKSIAALVAILAMTQGAVAQTADCRSIANPGPRLACYDTANPPTVSVAPSPTATATPIPARPVPLAMAPVITRPASKVDQAKYVDTISAEDALMNSRLRNICRGC